MVIKMKLDEIYIKESIRIRKEYLTNLTNIITKEDEIRECIMMMENIKQEMEDVDEPTEEFFMLRLTKINDTIDEIRKYITPYYDKITELDKTQRVLYHSIKEKYPDISDDEIQNQIVPHIIPIDKKFVERNKDLYAKILEREK